MRLRADVNSFADAAPASWRSDDQRQGIAPHPAIGVIDAHSTGDRAIAEVPGVCQGIAAIGWVEGGFRKAYLGPEALRIFDHFLRPVCSKFIMSLVSYETRFPTLKIGCQIVQLVIDVKGVNYGEICNGLWLVSFIDRTASGIRAYGE